MKPFGKILIANRGEIACRVIKTAREMGISTVAVYSEADKTARHTRLADEAVCLGPAPAAQSYLNTAAVLAAAQETGAQAIHPGYGFLSENTEFAKKCAKAGVVFIGPPPAAMAAMAAKNDAKTLMEKAGVPVLPGYHGEKQDAATLKKQAEKIGFPLLVKAVAGGGGKGMRLVEKAADLPAALAAAAREGKSSFGDGRVLLEKYLKNPRHVEVQVFADSQGHCVYLFERDCSLQRRHQKVVEEAPAPGVSAKLRSEMGAAAVKAAQAVGYVGAGTVEFLLEPAGRFYFMEMNTRLQVEHPITEMITGQDLVAWQLRVAAGENLPLSQKDLHINGHAMEVRLYAEDPARDFLPVPGNLHTFTHPPLGGRVRLDSGVEAGDTISPHYDPMIAKLIAHGADRAEALATLKNALARTHITGTLTTNLAYLRRALELPEFTTGKVHTGLLGTHHGELTAPAPEAAHAPVLAALGLLLSRPTAADPWAAGTPWRLSATASETLHLLEDDVSHNLFVEYIGGRFRIDGVNAGGTLVGNALSATIDGHRLEAVFSQCGHSVSLATQTGQWAFRHRELMDEAEETEAAQGTLTAPTSGVVVTVSAKQGKKVAHGENLMVLEAMKTEYRINAPANGTIEKILAGKGDYVEKDAVLIAFAPEEQAEACP